MSVKLVDTTKEYIRSLITVTKNGIEYDPSTDVVHFGFSPDDHANDVTWYVGSWETAGTKHYARFLYGDGMSLVPGHYTVFVKVTDNPEVPVKNVGILEVVGEPPKPGVGRATLLVDADAAGTVV